MPLFEESQQPSRMQKSLFLVLAGLLVATNLVVLLVVGSRAVLPLLWVTLPILSGTLVWALGTRLRIRVDDRVLRVQLWPFSPSKKIPRGQIHSAHQRTVRPFEEFGGWGIKFNSGHTLYSLGGNNAVTLEYFYRGKNRKLTITTERGDELLAALSL